MKKFSFKPEIWNYLEEELWNECILYEVLPGNQVNAYCDDELFYQIHLAAYAKKRTEETGLVYLTRRQMNMPGFSLRKTLAEHGRRGFLILEEIPEDD